MIPIFALAAASFSVALYKWFALAFRRKPSQRRITELLKAVAQGDEHSALENAKPIRGPVGTMLYAGAMHLNEPRELIEEVMYESVLATRLRSQRLLPFIAISAAAAPLLGLLGTVTGIINTFKLITVFGTGDVKTLSGGISEALITTEFGLIVAIPSLLLHALLSRKARGIVDQMEKYSVAFVNQVGKSPFRRRSPPAQIGPLHDLGAAPKAPNGGAVPTDEHIKEIVTDLLIARGMEAIRDQRKTAVTPRHESADDARGSSAARRDVVAGAGAPTAKVH
jgi:biopolymer transport protein ExbB/TolQ